MSNTNHTESISDLTHNETRMTPRRYQVGDEVVVTPKCLERIKWHSRQAAHPGYLSDTYIQSISDHVNEIGVVSHTHPPGYEVTVSYGDGDAYQVKDNWIEPAGEGMAESERKRLALLAAEASDPGFGTRLPDPWRPELDSSHALALMVACRMQAIMGDNRVTVVAGITASHTRKGKPITIAAVRQAIFRAAVKKGEELERIANQTAASDAAGESS